MAHRSRTKSRAGRRIAERTKRNAAAVKAGVTAAEDAKRRPRHARNVAHLDYLLSRRVISVMQASAGTRFQRDFQLSGTVLGRLISQYEPNLPKKPKRYSTPPPDAPSVIEARERFEAAVKVLGPLAAVTIHVSICDQPPSTWGANGKPNNDATGLLRYALSILSLHYSRLSYPRVAAEAGAAPSATRLHNSEFAAAAL